MRIFAIQNNYSSHTVGRNCHSAVKNNGTIKDVGIAMPTYVSKDKFVSKVSFGAKRLPSGEYSDWFVGLVRKNLRNASEAMRKHIADFREEETSKYIFKRFFAGTTIDRNVSTRENDYLKVVADLKDKNKPVDIGKQHYEYYSKYQDSNEIKGSYSSPQDWDNRSSRIEYVPDDSPDTDLSNGT